LYGAGQEEREREERRRYDPFGVDLHDFWGRTKKEGLKADGLVATRRGTRKKREKSYKARLRPTITLRQAVRTGGKKEGESSVLVCCSSQGQRDQFVREAN